jgi:hypothetical protein
VESAAQRVHQNIDKPRILQAVCPLRFPHIILEAYNLDSYNLSMERKIFWIVFTVLGLLADFLLPIWWGLAATIPCLFIAWWVAYRSDWF